MRTALIYVISFLPFFIYNGFCFYNSKPNAHIDKMQIIISGILGLLGYTLAQRILNWKKR